MLIEIVEDKRERERESGVPRAEWHCGTYDRQETYDKNRGDKNDRQRAGYRAPRE